MGNTNNKRHRYQHRQYASQYSISDIFGRKCIGTAKPLCKDMRPWSRFSRRSWSDDTLNDPLNISKTAWPVPRFEAMFLPEFKVREDSLKSDYFFIDIISKGAYGRVYKVQKYATNEIYALKVIRKAKIVAENAVIQAKQEVSIQQAVGHHPFIANSSNHWQGRKTLYILTEYIGGGELLSLVEECGKLPENVTRIYVGEIALALDFLHNAGIVHRDLKATNVLLDNEGHAVLIDFGLAKWLRPTQRTGTFCGTLEYMAPEILMKEYYGHEVDWWSLGVLACFMLTNQVNHEVKVACQSSYLILKYPTRENCDVKFNESNTNCIMPGTLPPDVKSLSSAAVDLLKRLLQPNPRIRLHTILALQRISFYMGHDLRSYTLKEVSPFQLLGRKIHLPLSKALPKKDFSDFDSFIGSSVNRTWNHTPRSER